jgi:hypothetical protein
MMMNLIETFDYFNDPANDRLWWPLDPNNVESIPLMAAGVRLSGRMDECRTAEDLREAIAHSTSLVSAGIVTTEQWAAESRRVEAEVEEEMDKINAELNAIAESN